MEQALVGGAGHRLAAGPCLLYMQDGAELPGCPACGDEGPTVPVPTGHGRAELCRTCAWVLKPCPSGRWYSFEPALRVGWSGIWQRQHMTGAGEPNPRWPGVRGPARIERLEPYEVHRLF